VSTAFGDSAKQRRERIRIRRNGSSRTFPF
jgi:hypothetical protein